MHHNIYCKMINAKHAVYLFIHLTKFVPFNLNHATKWIAISLYWIFVNNNALAVQ